MLSLSLIEKIRKIDRNDLIFELYFGKYLKKEWNLKDTKSIQYRQDVETWTKDVYNEH